MSRKSLPKKTDEMTGRIEQAYHDVQEIAGMELTALASEAGTTMGAILADPAKAGRNLVQLAKDNPEQTLRLTAGALVVLREIATMRRRHVKPVRNAVEVEDADFTMLTLTEDSLFVDDLREHARARTTEAGTPAVLEKANDLIDLLVLTLTEIFQRQQDEQPRENDEIVGAYVLDLIDAMRAEMSRKTLENEDSRTKGIVEVMLRSQFEEVNELARQIMTIVNRH